MKFIKIGGLLNQIGRNLKWAGSRGWRFVRTSFSWAGKTSKVIYLRIKPIAKVVRLWVWKILKALYLKIKQGLSKRIATRYGAGAKVATAMTLFTIIGLLLSGGLKSDLGILQIFLWLLITLASIAAVGGIIATITYAVKNKKTLSGKNLLWILTTAIVLLIGASMWWWWDSILNLFTPSFTFSGMTGITVPFAIVIAAVIILTLLFKGDWATTIRKGAWSAVTVFIAVSLLLLFVDWRANTGMFTAAVPPCQPFVSSEVRQCILTEKAIIMTAGQLTRAGEFEFCVVKPKQGRYEAKEIGVNTFQVRSVQNALPIQYKLVPGKCPDRF